MPEISGYSEVVHRTQEEEREYREVWSAARDEQALGSLRYVADNEPYCSRGSDSNVLAWLESRGWITKKVIKNPSAHIGTVRDRVEWRLTDAGREALAQG